MSIEATNQQEAPMSKRITGRSALIAILALVSYTGDAVAMDDQREDSSRSAEAIVGSWAETTTIANGPTFSGLVTFDDGGSTVGSYQGNVNTAGPLSTSFTASHGRWIHEGGRTYSTTSLQLVSDLAGNLVFVNKLRQRITLNKAATTYRSVVRAEFYDPVGNLVFASEGTTQGQRIRVEPLR
jgi:hypothetical protein